MKRDDKVLTRKKRELLQAQARCLSRYVCERIEDDQDEVVVEVDLGPLVDQLGILARKLVKAELLLDHAQVIDGRRDDVDPQ